MEEEADEVVEKCSMGRPVDLVAEEEEVDLEVKAAEELIEDEEEEEQDQDVKCGVTRTVHPNFW
jgi:hypothetical protein